MTGPRRRRSTCAGLLVLLVALTGVRAAAQAPSPPAPTTPQADRLPAGAPTRMGQELVARADVVAVVKVVSIRAAGQGAVVVRAIALEVLASGPPPHEPGDELVLVTYPGHVVEGLRELMFLTTMAGSERHELLYRTAEGDDGYAPKLEAARRTVALAAIPEPQARARATVDWLLERLAAEPGEHGDWWARYALDELGWMAQRHPAVFRPGDGVRVGRAGLRWLDGGPDADLAEDVERVSQAVRQAARRLYDEVKKAPSPP